VKVATWNVNGIRARHAQFADWVSSSQPDVICLQEIKASLAQVPAEICELPGYSCYWHGAGGYSGVSLHLRRAAFDAEPEYSHPSFDRETRIVQARLGQAIFASVYVPNGGKDFPAKMLFLQSLIDYVRELHARGFTIVLCGDMNVARTDRDVHPKERKPNVIGQRADERALFEQLIASGLVDVGRALDPDNDELFTWWAPWRNLRQRNIGWRLDYVLASEPLARRALRSAVLREVGTSDHGPVVVEFSS
jgi:exodeoxyribonuclease III